jgi:hypothetical protein
VGTLVQAEPALSVKLEESSTPVTEAIGDLPVVQATEIPQKGKKPPSSKTHPKTQSNTQFKLHSKTALLSKSKLTRKPESYLENSAGNCQDGTVGGAVGSSVGSAVGAVPANKNKTLLAVDRLILSVMLPGSYTPPEMRITQRLIYTIRKNGGNNWLATICPPLVRRVLIDNDIRLESRKVLKSICLATWKSGRLQAVLGNATFAKNIRCSLNTV